MSRQPNTRPHRPDTPAHKAGRVATTHRPGPLCNRGRAAGGVPSSVGDYERPEKPGGWIPKEYLLPDTLDGIERGRVDQRGRFPDWPDDSRAARLARLTCNQAANRCFPEDCAANRETVAARVAADLGKVTETARKLAW
jgi:hypothetical protein